ncbi:MAG TPA: T9SS type A sorting domain-containing protein [Bacteroidota bacterium]|jgi:hypothetical protein
MKLQVRNLLFVVFALALFYPLTLSAQFVSSTAWLDIRDDVGGHDSLVFGTHQSATYCLDTAIGENASPPYPPGGFYAVFQSIPGRANCFTTLGIIKKDLRDFSTIAKKDTFYIDFANLDSIAQLPGVNITVRWPDAAHLAAICDSMFLSDRVGGAVIPGRIDMMTQDNVVISDAYDPNGTNITAPTVRLRVFRWGVHQPYTDAVPKDNQTAPKSYALHQNYPNPFNPSTSIEFDILQRAATDISVYNLLGQKVTTLVSREMAPGVYTTTWNGQSDRGIPATSGVYFVRMSAQSTAGNGKEEHFSAVRKLVLMK